MIEIKEEPESAEATSISQQPALSNSVTRSDLTDAPTYSEAEEQHFFDIVNTFRAYKRAFLKRLDERRSFIVSDRMTSRQRALLAPYSRHLNHLETAAAHNFEILKLIIAETDELYVNKRPLSGDSELVKKPDSQLNTDRLNSVLNQIAREWTAEGAPERAISYGRILATLERYFPEGEDHKPRSALQVLVPGVGLGRLSFEIARLGFSAQGNEFSLMMLLVASYILNETKTANVLSFYPYIAQMCNNLSADRPLTRLTFPDVCPSHLPPESALPPGALLSMTAGSFADVYSAAEHRLRWDSVVTCFFLDTAPNVLTYIELIKGILKPAGVWINFGPLMYHWAESADTPSIEPSYDLVRGLIEASGFEFVEEETGITSAYTCNPHSMLSYEYKCVFFVCRIKK